MTTILYAAPFDESQLRQLGLPANEYDHFRASLALLQPKDSNSHPRLPTTQELQSFTDQNAKRHFEQIGATGLYRHPIIPELCCVVEFSSKATSMVPGNNVMLVNDGAFQWTFFQRGQTADQDRVRVLNGGNPSLQFATPNWIPQPEADTVFGNTLAAAGTNIVVLNLKRGGTRIPNLPSQAYRT